MTREELAAHLVARVRSAIGRATRYSLGKGGKDPASAHPADAEGRCDCSGLVDWVLGLEARRYPDGRWAYTDSLEADARKAGEKGGILEPLATPEPGCVVVYGAGPRVGHCGIVTELQATPPHWDSARPVFKVVHCSLSSYRRHGDAIRETWGDVFVAHGARFGRYVPPA